MIKLGTCNNGSITNEDKLMETDDTKSSPPVLIYISRRKWAIVALLFLLTLTGCLTSHAAGPPEQEIGAVTRANVPTATPPPTATMSPTSAVTLVPNMAIRAFQETTPTVTATETATPTLEPTATPEPTNTPPPTDTPSPTDTPRPTAIKATPLPVQAYAWLDNYYPAPGSVITVYGSLFKNGRPVNGAQMGVTWSYTHGRGYCTAYTGIDGRAACTQNIGAALQNYWVYVDVVFVYDDELHYAKTGFVTDP